MTSPPRLDVRPCRAFQLEPGDVLVSMRAPGAPRTSLVMNVDRDDSADSVTLTILDSVIGDIASGDAREATFRCKYVDVFGRLER